ncbi:hypothetical protein JG688_00012257 [Phytophthora aleatoria]|uniref:DDE-1 domain-containing protein n=1 Tax=Phytophthora aleatoria TaxID=2496075 RepID=A0A8J5MEF4_9STRA|nr:hypothetical protein JG688_00012257 [Phytophthora aleatoria]
MTVVAAVSAAGSTIPPLIVVLEKPIYKSDKAALSIEGARVTGAPKGVCIGRIFRLWLRMFAAEVAKLNVPFPIVLVLDNSSTHLDLKSISAASDMKILLLALPPNATHMYRLLDVSVFKYVKAAVKDTLQLKLLNTADMQLSKKDAISILCVVYKSAIIEHPDNAINGLSPLGSFRRQWSTGIPVGVAKGMLGTDARLKRQRELVQLEARDEMLTLPPAPGKKDGLTVDIVGELVASEALD